MRHQKNKNFNSTFSLFVMGIIIILLVGTIVPGWAAPGDLDITFSIDGYDIPDLGIGIDAGAWAVAIDSSGRAVVVGNINESGDYNFLVLRYNTDGTLDTTFDSDGFATTDVSGTGGFDSAYAVVIQGDGKIVVAGESSSSGTPDFALVRYNADGSRDATFGAGGVVITDISGGDIDCIRSIAIYPGTAPKAGYIVAGGYANSVSEGYNFAIAQYMPLDGALDGGFNSGGILTQSLTLNADKINAIAIDASYMIVAVGDAESDIDPQFAVCRYDDTGAFDPVFNSPGDPYYINLAAGTFTDESARSLTIQPDGKILVAGYVRNEISASYDVALLRLLSDGSGLDNGSGGFAFPDGYVMTDIGGFYRDDYGHAVALESDGDIVIGGYHVGGDSFEFALLRYDTGGAPDFSFGSGGAVTTNLGMMFNGDIINGLALQPDGKAVVAGTSDVGVAVARYDMAATINEYYVDISASDNSGDGSIGEPWKTLHYAFGSTSPVADNDIINVQAGNYNTDNGEDFLPLIINKNGLQVYAFGTVIIESVTASSWMIGLMIDADQVLLQGFEISDFVTAGIQINGSNNVVDNCMIHTNSGYGIYISVIASDNQVINDCEIFQNLMGGIEIYDSPNNLIQNNSAVGAGIYDNGGVSTGNGIHIWGAGATNNDIINTRIYHSGDLGYVQDIGISIDGSVAATNIDILGNSIEAHANCGLWISNCDVTVKGNKFADNKNGIWVDADAGTASPEIWNNLFFSGPAPQMDYGIRLSTSSVGSIGTLTIYHNTLDGALIDGIAIENFGGGAAPEIFYNIISNSGLNGINNSAGAPSVQFNNVFAYGSIDYNNVPGSPGTGGIDADPDYTDIGSFDYHLKNTSLCIDSIPGSVVTDDLDGVTRPQDISVTENYPGGVYDMGCYEYVDAGTDTDGDGLPDTLELAGCTDPNNPDTDFDGINDGVEDVNLNGVVDSGETDPCNPDTDGDGFTDGEEVAYLTDFLNSGDYPVLIPGEYWVDPNPDELGTGTVGIPWNSLHRAVHHINLAAPGAYTIQVLAGTYQVEVSGGHEPDEVLMITHDNVTIQGAGIGNTIIDGIGAGSWGDGLDIFQANNVVISDLEIQNFFANGIHMGGASLCDIVSCSMHDNLGNGIMIEPDSPSPPYTPSSENEVRDNCMIYRNSEAGIYVRDSHTNEISNNMGSIYDNGTSSISLGVGVYIFGTVSANNVITGNSIYSFGTATGFYQTIGIKLDNVGIGNQIINNEIYGHLDTFGSNGFGIEVMNSDAAIERNILYDNVEGITVAAEFGGNADPDIRNNLIYDGPASNMEYGIFLEVDGGSDVSPTIYHNTIDGGSVDGIFMDVISGTASPRVEFNIISNFDTTGINYSGGTPEIDFNNVWGNTVDYAFGSGGPSSISVPPVYVNEVAGDYHLQNTSGCIDAIPEPTLPPPHPVNDDLDGELRPQPSDGSYDMGCYEFVPEPVSPTYYYVTFVAGTGGSIVGSSQQRLLPGRDCTPVTAVAGSGYVFTGWSGSYTGTDNPLEITNVYSNMTITANFEAVTLFAVTFTAGTGGVISGNTSQTVATGGSCSQVEAVPDKGYQFDGWGGDYTGITNPLTITNVAQDMSVSASFSILTYDVGFEAGPNGSIIGDVAQKVNHGANTTAMTPAPDTGYSFKDWTGDYTGDEIPLVIPNVISDMRVTANFLINEYQVLFNATVGGSLSGETDQMVEYGGSSTPVTALADIGYEFTGWTGDVNSSAGSLMLENITSDMSVIASFAVNHPADMPELISPIKNTLVGAGAVIMVAGSFYDPEGDAHVESIWQIRRFGEADPFYSVASSVDLTQHVTGNKLEEGVQYEWRVGYVDAGSQDMVWSGQGSFIAGTTVEDNNIPAIPPGFEMKDYRLMSFIQWPADFSFLNILDTTIAADTTSEDFKIGTYNPLTGMYEQYPDLEIEPGRAYWVLARYGMKLVMDGVFVSPDQDFTLKLLYDEGTGNGWNMIGGPNGAESFWYDLEVVEYDGLGNAIYGPMPISMLSEDNEYIDKSIWRWEEGGYTSDHSDSFIITPYEGVWVRSKNNNIALVFPVSAQSGLLAKAALKGKEYFGGIFNQISPAYAGAVSNDSPPMPMGYSDAGSSSDLGCFIKVISADEK